MKVLVSKSGSGMWLKVLASTGRGVRMACMGLVSAFSEYKALNSWSGFSEARSSEVFESKTEEVLHFAFSGKMEVTQKAVKECVDGVCEFGREGEMVEDFLLFWGFLYGGLLVFLSGGSYTVMVGFNHWFSGFFDRLGGRMGSSSVPGVPLFIVMMSLLVFSGFLTMCFGLEGCMVSCSGGLFAIVWVGQVSVVCGQLVRSGAMEASSRTESTMEKELRGVLKVLESFSVFISTFVIPLRYTVIYSMGWLILCWMSWVWSVSWAPVAVLSAVSVLAVEQVLLFLHLYIFSFLVSDLLSGYPKGYVSMN
uniref:ATP synthase F0 subunit 6 n=1 Tax=Pteria penguin TaxID=113549 RepID=A0A1P8CZ18_PTEPN|nr:ATP synthase F0 subunit 6 [Pteria penguin]